MVVQSAYKWTYVLLIVTNDRPYTMEVVGVCPWEHGGSEAIVTAEIFVASTGTLEGERGKEGYYGTVNGESRKWFDCLSIVTVIANRGNFMQLFSTAV